MIYGVGFSVLASIIAWMNLHALRKADLLQLRRRQPGLRHQPGQVAGGDGERTQPVVQPPGRLDRGGAGVALGAVEDLPAQVPGRGQGHRQQEQQGQQSRPQRDPGAQAVVPAHALAGQVRDRDFAIGAGHGSPRGATLGGS